MKKGNFIDIQNEIVSKYNVKLDPNSKCWSRIHAHVKERRVCKWKQANSIESTFTLLHEIGHLETTTGKMRRCESEYYATAWAIDRCVEYGLEIPQKLIKDYQDYIDMERDRGVRRGGQNLPVFKLQLPSVQKHIEKPVVVQHYEEAQQIKKAWRVGFKINGIWEYKRYSDEEKMMNDVHQRITLCEKVSINFIRPHFSLN